MKNKFILGIFAASFISVLFMSSVNPVSAAGCNTATLRVVHFGQKGERVTALQDCLISRGYAVSPDEMGNFDKGTQKAIKSFYRSELGLKNWPGRSFGPKAIALLRGKNVTVSPVTGGMKGFKYISSEQELKKYFENARRYYGGIGMGNRVTTMEAMPMSKAQSASNDLPKTTPDRVSTTNVQVAGIDEPDIVKTDGTTIYFSRSNYYERDPFVGLSKECQESKVCVSENLTTIPRLGVTAVTAFPLSSLGIASNSITEKGEMLLVKDKKILIILDSRKIVAYDISNPAKPVKKWTNELKNNTQITTARLKEGTMYVITSTYPDAQLPCPFIPMARNNTSMVIPCNTILVPNSVKNADTIYTVFAIDPVTGVEKKTLTYLGDTNNTTISMFGDNLYLAYGLGNNNEEVVALDFFKTELKDLISNSTQIRIEEILKYNISNGSKSEEIMRAFKKEAKLLSESGRLKLETEIENRSKNYMIRRIRDIDRSMIARIGLNNLTVEASNTIPGHLLNQFSMDEYKGNLRVAVTVGDRWNADNNKNDVYVLDSKLNTIGSVVDLGITERIYSARFIGDRGYVVTFRQIDPFYVLDLSNPKSPKMVGELKIPGYSAYLEALSDSLVLGVGKEERRVKISLFDVSDPKNPIEKSKYMLDEGWTEVENNHRAFLLDPKHKVFFIPGGKGGYVISYANDTLSLSATVAANQVKRALFIEDMLYIVAENKITVLDENTWKEVKVLEY